MHTFYHLTTKHESYDESISVCLCLYTSLNFPWSLSFGTTFMNIIQLMNISWTNVFDPFYSSVKYRCWLKLHELSVKIWIHMEHKMVKAIMFSVQLWEITYCSCSDQANVTAKASFQYWCYIYEWIDMKHREGGLVFISTFVFFWDDNIIAIFPHPFPSFTPTHITLLVLFQIHDLFSIHCGYKCTPEDWEHGSCAQHRYGV